MTATPYYIESGYDPNDGLPEGRWMRNTWGVLVFVEIEPPPEPITDQARLRACPTCHAHISELCRTRTGRHREAHASRLVTKQCVCGAPLDWRRKMCDTCRAEARRINGRNGMRNTRARRRAMDSEAAA